MSTATMQNTMPMYQPNPSPRVEQARAIAEQQAIAARALQNTQLAVDPALQAPINPPRTSTPPQGAGPQTSTSQSNTPQSAGREKDTVISTSQAQSIPSISHLVHATDSVSVMSDNKSNSSRAGSKSPKDKDESRPKDIPHEKLNIRVEDRRAISVLDRKFAF
jgi:hypothetical protein